MQVRANLGPRSLQSGSADTSPTARNNMRSMNVGDKAFFYHSNCKEPGIAGIMEIVKEFSPDGTSKGSGIVLELLVWKMDEG